MAGQVRAHFDRGRGPVTEKGILIVGNDGVSGREGWGWGWGCQSQPKSKTFKNYQIYLTFCLVPWKGIHHGFYNNLCCHD